MATVEELLVFGKSHCHSAHAKILLGNVLKKNPLELLTCLEEEVPSDLEELYQKEVLALQEGRPIQYVMGEVNFHGIPFFVDERVLIPRFETEELVEKTILYVQKYFQEPIDILDLCTGSGVIGLTLEKKLSTKTVDLSDISEDALEVAKKNKERLNSKANLISSNYFQNIQKKYDLIISNPPYIAINEKIEQIVKDNEPEIALYAGEEGLDSYQEILKNIQPYMKEKCIIAFEIGANQKESIINLVKKYLPNTKIETHQDLSGRNRMLFIFQNLE